MFPDKYTSIPVIQAISNDLKYNVFITAKFLKLKKNKITSDNNNGIKVSGDAQMQQADTIATIMQVSFFSKFSITRREI